MILEEKIDKLVQHAIDHIEDEDVAHILREGCTGYDNMEEEDINNEYDSIFE